MVSMRTVGESKLIMSGLPIHIYPRPWAVDSGLNMTRSQLSGLLLCVEGLSGTRSLTKLLVWAVG